MFAKLIFTAALIANVTIAVASDVTVQFACDADGCGVLIDDHYEVICNDGEDEDECVPRALTQYRDAMNMQADLDETGE